MAARGGREQPGRPASPAEPRPAKRLPNWGAVDARDDALDHCAARRPCLVTPTGKHIPEADVTPDLALRALESTEDRHVIALALRVALRAVAALASAAEEGDGA